MRKPIKKINFDTKEFIPESMRDMDKHAKNMLDRPLIFTVRPMTRDESFEFSELIEVKEDFDSRNVKGLGKASKYVWKKCLTEIKNVVTDKGEFESVKGKEKDDLLESGQLDIESLELAAYVRTISSLEPEEAKN